MKIKITCIHALGTFSGILESEDMSQGEAQQYCDKLAASINKIQHLAVRDGDGGEFVFSESIVKNSVFKFLIVNV